jgi:hypothetical protein
LTPQVEGVPLGTRDAYPLRWEGEPR